ncbi:nicotinate-nucleotide adenylyltransferase [Oecophyllibacter saccharovorans]|nr:nicotinate-nucleotide adenylyltransferase [Oecophyllibacter saccharovorans]TPW33805.1 nicotinate-nucleotide adenylyltransferase [Oecophyllibacter saccharovorans]
MIETVPSSSAPLPRFGDGRRMRIGLLGGSFNPAHAGHQQIAREALKRLGLDQVWLLVSPGNPLKPAKGMAPFAERLASAEKIADGRRIVASDLEGRLGERYTVRTVAALKRLYPRASFIWLMGADGLAQFPRWKEWRQLARLVPIAVFPRPGSVIPALKGQAAQVLHAGRCPARQGRLLPGQEGWTFLEMRENPLSATALRQAGAFPAAQTLAPSDKPD